ncbi:MAG: LysM peptidoglycan-binding domain-containing protein [Anaerolineae bacterium]|nr:LysM peptidoglycan-binding domain-containing protein [Anaerolineae bacterium]
MDYKQDDSADKLSNAARGITVLVMAMLMIAMVVLGATPAHPVPVPEGVQDSTEEPSKAPPAPAETIPPSTPLATLTPSQTLKPPPTFEPPTQTGIPTDIPTATATPTTDYGISVQGLHGLESPTPSTTPGCEPRKDWQLTYEIQALDTLTGIAAKYNTTVWELQEGNCLTDADTIIAGQTLKVPGGAHPGDGIECVPWEVLQPLEGMITVPGSGELIFNWIGPRAPLNLIRITKPEDDPHKNDEGYQRVVEVLVELKQNGAIALSELPAAGWYTWQVFPLDRNFQQIHCLESPRWSFRKDETTETSNNNPSLGSGIVPTIESLVSTLAAP